MNKKMLIRYWPFGAIVAVQLLLVTLSSEPDQTTETAGFEFGDGSASGGGFDGSSNGGTSFGGTSGAGGTSGGFTSTGGGQVASGGGTSGGVATGSGGSGGGGQAGGTGGGNTPAAVGSGGGGSQQQLDQLGRPQTGDKSKCGKDGILQEDISLQSPPCMPAYAGDNGGATYQGVDAETIKVVVYYPEYGQGTQQVLAANGLAMTENQAEELHNVLEQFFNGHYEYYGRKLEVVAHISPAEGAIELRAESKAVVQKHKPFAVLFYAQGLMPQVMADEFSRAGVLNLGVTPVADDFFLERAPFVWSQVIQGYRMADHAADYYCKKMHGKNATLAGDPAMRITTRKLGVGSSEDPNELKTAQRFISQVTGGMCGSPADGVQLYKFSSDPDTATNQLPALVSRMKADGITTTYRINVCAEGDNQGYFPENIRSEVFDDDFVGRVYAATCSATQLSNTFGIGMFPQGIPKEQKEFYIAVKSVNPNYEPPYLAEGPFQGLIFLSRLIQYAGPNLNPQTVYQGSRSMPQIGGWENPNPFPGWKGANPYTPEYHVGIAPDSFTAKVDARQIFWSNTAVSESDGATGAWVGVDGGRRYEVGKWPAGEPKQP